MLLTVASGTIDGDWYLMAPLAWERHDAILDAALRARPSSGMGA